MARAGPNAGVTLVEMMIVMAIIGIMATVSVPYFLKDRPAADVRDAANRLANDLRNARFRAISLKRDVYVEFEPGGEADFYTAYADHDDDGSASWTTLEVGETRITFPDAVGGNPGRYLGEGIEFGLGDATSSPDADASAPAGAIDVPANPLVFEPRGTVRWPAGSSEPSAGVYVRHADQSNLVQAVIVTPTGAIKTWRYDSGGWR